MGAPGGDLNSLACRPQWPEEVTKRYAYVSTLAVDGTRQSAQLYSGSLRVWRLRFVHQTETQYTAFTGFLTDNNGGYNGFIWTHPVDGGAAINVCIRESDPVRFSGRYNNRGWELILYERAA